MPKLDQFPSLTFTVKHSTCNIVGRKTKKITAAAELKLLTTGVLETCSSLGTANLSSSSCTKQRDLIICIADG